VWGTRRQREHAILKYGRCQEKFHLLEILLKRVANEIIIIKALTPLISIE
jgi:hypothetical protein